MKSTYRYAQRFKFTMFGSTVHISSTSALEAVNSFAPQDVVQTSFEPITMMIIGLVTAIVKLVGHGVGLVNAVVGAVTRPPRPPEAKGEPWTLWMHAVSKVFCPNSSSKARLFFSFLSRAAIVQTSDGYQGVDGNTVPGKDPLSGGGGPFPSAMVYQEQGKLIGSNWDEKGYIYDGKWNGLPIWPHDEKWAEGQDPAFVTLVMDRPKDPTCIIEVGVSRDVSTGRSNLCYCATSPNQGNICQIDANPNSHVGFSAYNAKACGVAPWYHSGKEREAMDGTEHHVPCFWLGEPETMSLQLHLKSHSLFTKPEYVKRINRTAETRHEHACNTPGKSKSAVPRTFLIPVLFVAITHHTLPRYLP